MIYDFPFWDRTLQLVWHEWRFKCGQHESAHKIFTEIRQHGDTLRQEGNLGSTREGSYDNFRKRVRKGLRRALTHRLTGVTAAEGFSEVTHLLPTSFAQNFEDIRLYRVLKNEIPEWYIDVGTFNADWLSTTRVLYEAGWCGINIEPIPNLANAIRARRPRDTTLQCCVGAHQDEVTLWIASTNDGRSAAAPARSTTVAATRDLLHQQGFATAPLIVPQLPLTEVLAEHAHRFAGDLHLLKIDVETAENEVLAGFDFDLYRPWIVVCEGRPDFPLLSANAYELAVYDELNSWYVDRARPDLAELLAHQTNTKDDGQWAFPCGYIGGIPDVRDSPVPPRTEVRRAQRELLARYLRGRVLEVGPGVSTFPVTPGGTTVTYLERGSMSEPHRDHVVPEWAGLGTPQADIECDLDTDANEIAERYASQFDGVVASHIVEHVANPLQVLSSFHQVLTDRGSLVLILPDRDQTEDKRRPATSLRHLCEEFIRNVQHVDDDHIREYWDSWLLSPDDHRPIEPHAVAALRARSVHAHCWNPEDAFSMVLWQTLQASEYWDLDDIQVGEEIYDAGWAPEFGYALRKAAPNRVSPKDQATRLISAWISLVKVHPRRDVSRLDKLRDVLIRDAVALGLSEDVEAFSFAYTALLDLWIKHEDLRFAAPPIFDPIPLANWFAKFSDDPRCRVVLNREAVAAQIEVVLARGSRESPV